MSAFIVDIVFDILTKNDIYANDFMMSYHFKFALNNYEIKHAAINFTSTNDEDYNSLFSIDDIIYSIKTAKDSAAGQDEIYYQIFF
jgi:hypothetical protein